MTMNRSRRSGLHILMAALMLAAPAAVLAQTADAAEAVNETPLSTGDTYQLRAAIDKWMGALSARAPGAVKDYVMRDLQGAFQGASADYDADAFERSVKLSFAGAADPGSVDVWANDIEELVGSGDMAVVRSTRTFTHTLAGGRATSVKMRLLEVYRRYDDGSWRMARFLGFPG
jgi:ketosteroid isomerase-like protein